MERAAGTAYLELVTELLQRQRRADPVAGVWEAADLQWWFTRDPHPDEQDAAFWRGGDGAPVTAAVFTRWAADRYGCDVLGVPTPAAWEFVAARAAELPGATIEMAVAPGTGDAAARAGFTGPGETLEMCWLDAADRPDRRDPPEGYAIVPRPEQTGPHPMAKRNGPAVEARLRQCPLYDPALDLAVLAPDGSPAAYALFWPDQRTGVGLVEPVRVEDGHAGRGVAGTLLRAGLDGLAARGCTRLKVGHEPANTAARRLYLGAGFRPGQRVTSRTRPGGGAG
ncbi:MAG TPA: GNAT family N-acetyltransferase [Mycobacteriales bacterium]|nr:GNAT family N-acetyltransferase [Mycobacteriales bacterium]